MLNLRTNQHIFIAIAPNHISNFENIIRSKQILDSTILINPGCFDYDNNLWSLVINGNIDLKYTESESINKLKYQFNKLLGYKKFIKKFHKQVSEYSNYTYYYCNLDDVLSNYIFHFLNKSRNIATDNYVVEDGILNYYYPESNIYKLKAKSFICKIFFGIKFFPPHNHPTGIDFDVVKAQYVRLPKKAIYSEKSIKLPFKDIHYEPEKDVILIIGQDIMHNCNEGPKYYKNRLKMLFEYVSNEINTETIVVYKPHRNGNYKIAEEILNLMFIKHKIYKSIIPVEECIVDIRPNKIFSFESSALLNLKIAVNEANIYIAALPFNKNQPKLLKIFKDLGIDILG